MTILAAVANEAAKLDWDVVVTAGVDGQHKPGSKHYTYEALDVRSKNFPSKRAKQDFISALLLRLGPSYEAFFESEGLPAEHFHIEFDPK